jgi:hypothetical protein
LARLFAGLLGQRAQAPTSLRTPTGSRSAPQVHGADIQDRDSAVGVLASIRHLFPWLCHVFADGGYAGEKLETTLAGTGQRTLAIVKRPYGLFARLPDAGKAGPKQDTTMPRRYRSSPRSPLLAAGCGQARRTLLARRLARPGCHR